MTQSLPAQISIDSIVLEKIQLILQNANKYILQDMNKKGTHPPTLNKSTMIGIYFDSVRCDFDW